jgi:Rod binding domain-containing protein
MEWSGTSGASLALSGLNAATSRVPALVASTNEKARASAQEFEGVFLNSMFQQMFAGVDGEGPMGGKGGSGVWRSFLTDEYAKTFAKSGGVGIADHVFRALLAQQEASGKR